MGVAARVGGVIVAAACGGAQQLHCVSADAITCQEVSGLAADLKQGAAGSARFYEAGDASGGRPEEGLCPELGRVSGCSTPGGAVEQTSWTYVGDLVERTCAADELKLRGDGSPCSATSGAPVEIDFTNRGDVTFTVYAADAACAEASLAVIEPGEGAPRSS